MAAQAEMDSRGEVRILGCGGGGGVGGADRWQGRDQERLGLGFSAEEEGELARKPHGFAHLQLRVQEIRT